MLRNTLAENNIFSCQAKADADRLIIQTAINLQFKNMVVIFEDVDVLVLLTEIPPTDQKIYFQKSAKAKIPQKVYSSKNLETVLSKCKQHSLFLNAFTGCDTTSAFFQQGKNVFAKNIEEKMYKILSNLPYYQIF